MTASQNVAVEPTLISSSTATHTVNAGPEGEAGPALTLDLALESGDPAAPVTFAPAPHSLSFTVIGTPVQQGSHKAFVVNGHAKITDDNKKTLKPWRQDVTAAAMEALAGAYSSDRSWPQALAAVDLQVEFVMPRPKTHYRTGRFADVLRDNAPHFHATKPDSDKLLRALLDACTAAGIWRDDSQVAQIFATKRYASPNERACAHVLITALTS